MKAITKWIAVAAGAAGALLVARAGVELNRIVNGKIELPAGFTYTAHSGAENTAENSLEFIEKAIALQVPVLEVDVSVRNDGTPVLLHAETAGADEGVLLADALRLIAEKSDTVQVNLDLKAFTNIPEIADLIAETGLADRCFFTGVEAEHTQTVKIDVPDIPYYLNADLNKMRLEDEAYLKSIAEEVKRSGAIGLNCNYKNASKTLCEVFHTEGLKVSFWTADNKLVMRNLLTLSPDNITTRQPVLLESLLQ
ncbi:MAG: glycerophosphodiester phosphodiesterase [Candidatus Fimenecus sp.]